MRILFVIVGLIATACQPTVPLATITPTLPALTGEVVIRTPPEGALLYAEVIHISGSAAGVPNNQFELTLTGPDTQSIASSTIRLAGDSWRIEMPHRYMGEPIEVTIAARPVDASISSAYDLVTIAIAGLEYRPAGAFGAITFPEDGMSTGGDQIPVAGTASGIINNQLTLTLLSAGGTTVDSQAISLDNAFLIDEMPWSAAVSTNSYTGEAMLQLESEEQIIAISRLRIHNAAG